MDLKGRSYLKLIDFTPEEITYLIDLAAELKDKKKKDIPQQLVSRYMRNLVSASLR